MHGSGHWLGLNVHDVGRYHDLSGQSLEYRQGMVTTVEPGIYVRRDSSCDTRFHGIGVRIEDDILVTESGSQDLTAAIPKTVDDLEAIIGEAQAS